MPEKSAPSLNASGMPIALSVSLRPTAVSNSNFGMIRSARCSCARPPGSRARLVRGQARLEGVERPRVGDDDDHRRRVADVIQRGRVPAGAAPERGVVLAAHGRHADVAGQRVEGAFAVASCLNGVFQSPWKKTALASTSRVSVLIDPFGNSSGICASVRSETQPLIVVARGLRVRREVLDEKAGAVVLGQRVEVGGQHGEAVLDPGRVRDREPERGGVAARRAASSARDRAR